MVMFMATWGCLDPLDCLPCQACFFGKTGQAPAPLGPQLADRTAQSPDERASLMGLRHVDRLPTEHLRIDHLKWAP